MKKSTKGNRKTKELQGQQEEALKDKMETIQLFVAQTEIADKKDQIEETKEISQIIKTLRCKLRRKS